MFTRIGSSSYVPATAPGLPSGYFRDGSDGGVGIFESMEERRLRRVRNSYVVATLLHGVLFLLGDPRQTPEPPPKDERIELALVSSAPPAPNDGAQAAAAPPPQPAPPRPVPKVAAAKPVPPAPTGSLPPPSPRPQPAAPVPQPPAPPLSFREWQRQQRRFLPGPRVVQGGGQGGDDLISRKGRDRCEPMFSRRADLVLLLFDASGSLSEAMTAQALSCAQQAAKAGLASGAEVVVGTFARDLALHPPTRDLSEVQVALRAATDRTATMLPARQLQHFLDRDPDARVELVIVSDGWIPNTDEVLNWYRYFLESNPDNRGTMYTVGQRGHREAVDALRSIGFDVFQYDQIRGQ